MSDYIERADALCVVAHNCVNGEITLNRYDKIIGGIYEIPTADVVAVVRCKDCKHYAFTDNRVPQERVWWCYYWGYEIGADDYCSNGERKDDE